MKIRSEIFKGCISFLCLFIVLSVANIYLNTDYVALAVYIIFLIFVYMTNAQVLLKYMFMFVMFSYHIISVFLVENSIVFFHNLQVQSYRSQAFLPLLLSYVICFVGILLLESNNNSQILKYTTENNSNANISIGRLRLTEKVMIRIFSVILLALVIFMLFRMKNSFFYDMGGINRFDYRAAVFTGLDEKFYTYIAWFLPIPLLASNLKMRKRAIIFFVFYCLYMVWVGDKFGSLFMAFYIFILTTWLTKTLNKHMIKRVILIAVVTLTLLMIFISFQVLYERGSWSEVLIYFNNRLIGGQSDLWWKIFSSDAQNGWRVPEFFQDEVTAIFAKPANVIDYNFGIYKMMREAAPEWVVSNYLSKGIRFAASTQASMFYYFKFTGLYLGSFVLGIFCFVLVNKALKAYKSVDIFRSVCYTMLISKWYQVMAMSDITILGNMTTILAVILLLYLRYLKQGRTNTLQLDVNMIHSSHNLHKGGD